MQQRSLGPFSGRQLTTIIIALILVIGVPGSVWAVQEIKSVAIQDPESGLTAKVDSNGKLLVGDGSGGLSVDGSVSAEPLAPNRPWRIARAGSGFLSLAGPGPIGAAVNVTSLSATPVNAEQEIGFAVDSASVPSDRTNCSGARGEGLAGRLWELVHISDAAPLVVSFPTPLQYRPPAGRRACLIASVGEHSGFVNASGFYGTPFLGGPLPGQ